MVDDIDIWRAAKLMIHRHGADATTAAAMRADAMLKENDAAGVVTWKQIVRAIEELQRPRTNDAVH
jgi:carbon monoxide dehydrogenase subunit G